MKTTRSDHECLVTSRRIQGRSWTPSFNLLPIPALNGGQIVMELFRHRIGTSDKHTRYTNIGAIVVILLMVGWCIAIGRFVYGRLYGT